jgi:hypothetical protein
MRIELEKYIIIYKEISQVLLGEEAEKRGSSVRPYKNSIKV